MSKVEFHLTETDGLKYIQALVLLGQSIPGDKTYWAGSVAQLRHGTNSYQFDGNIPINQPIMSMLTITPCHGQPYGAMVKGTVIESCITFRPGGNVINGVRSYLVRVEEVCINDQPFNTRDLTIPLYAEESTSENA